MIPNIVYRAADSMKTVLTNVYMEFDLEPDNKMQAADMRRRCRNSLTARSVVASMFKEMERQANAVR
jgi:hypothetical protein